MTDSMKCPKGHKLPREGCTPLYCVGGGKQPKPGSPADVERKAREAIHGATDVALARAKAKPDPKSDMKEVPKDEKDATSKALATRVGQWAARKALLNTPEGLQGAEAEEWAQREGVSMLPIAVSELKYQLLYGDDRQRAEAARDVLDMNGMRRRESGGNNAPTIILNLGAGPLPWEDKREKVVSGEATRSEAPEVPAAGNGP